MSLYTDESLCLKDEVETCSGADSPGLVFFCLLLYGEDVYYDSELSANSK
jgi:hypothetical protein